ncbi:MAG: SH3 domain-containing protein, partial [Cyanobacteria bacterium J06554_3]
NVLGDGGFGQTFLVEDTHMPSNRQCVLKQLKPVHDKPELHQMVQDRFQREAAILEKLGEMHDQIPRLHAYFSEADQFYLVEEWVEGLTLTQKVIKDGPLSESAVQSILSNLLPVIGYVHSQRIVHRDIKPDNIILRQQDGKPVLIDFGAVKETMKTIINSGEQSTHSIVVGTPGYMPSEQLSGRPIYASDIYSVGMTAIFLLTGKIPQELSTDPQTGALSWREHAPHLSPGFANFIDCAAHMSSQSRFATVQDMQSVLNTLMIGQMATQVATQMPAEHNPAEYNPALHSGGTQPPMQGNLQNSSPNSAQTVISSSAGVAAANAGITPDIDINTVAGPVGSSPPTFNQPATAAFAQPASSGSSSSSGQWKGAVIVGGMVGISILLGALVLTNQLPGRVADSQDDPTTAVTTDVTGDNETKEDGDTADIDAGDSEDADTDDTDNSDAQDSDSSDAADSQPTPPTPTTPVATAPAAAPNANGSVTGSGSKNVRSGAGTSFGVVAEVSSGSRIRVVDRGTDAGGFPWYRIVTPSGQTGWIAGQLIQIDGDASPPRTPTPTPTPTPVDRTNATIVSQESGSKNIRSGPGTNFRVAHEAFPGDRVIIQDSARDSGGYLWYKVSFPESGAQGWIAGQLIRRD